MTCQVGGNDPLDGGNRGTRYFSRKDDKNLQESSYAGVAVAKGSPYHELTTAKAMLIMHIFFAMRAATQGPS